MMDLNKCTFEKFLSYVGVNFSSFQSGTSASKEICYWEKYSFETLDVSNDDLWKIKVQEILMVQHFKWSNDS